MRDSRTINYLLLEELLTALQTDPEIHSRRCAQADFVRKKLTSRIRSRLEALDFPEDMRRRYLDGDPEAEKCLGAAAGTLLSQRMQRQFRFLQSAKRSLALEFLEECLLDKEQVRFRKTTGLSAKVWLGFYNSTRVSTPETIQIIRDCLVREKLLSPGAECLAFEALRILDIFPANDPLKREVHLRRKNTGMSILEFLDHAYVGKDAWEAFYPIPGDDGADDDAPLHNTSQETLLKLIIGFGLAEEAAHALLALVDSGFLLPRDLIFLAAIQAGCGHPDLMPEILDFFNGDAQGDPIYTNPYSRKL